ncbi:MAG: ABC transporter ATP-binding protein/permease [Pseudonocardia sp.]|nr:ABC transporter ATP-binding protein/permease [Pseudonocardia sp.]
MAGNADPVLGAGPTVTGGAPRPDGAGSRLPVLLGYARPHRTVLMAAVVLGLLGSAAGLAQPLAAKAVIDALRVDGDLFTPVALLAALVLVSAVLSGVNLWLLERTAERVVRGVRLSLAHRLLRLRVHELDRHQPGDLVTRATADSTLLRSAATTALVQLVNGAAGLIGAIVLMAVLDLLLLGITIGVLTVVAVVVLVLLPRIQAAVSRAQDAVGGVGATLDRALQAARTVKASGAEARETAAVAAAVENAYDAGLTGARYSAVLGVLSGLAVQASFLAVLGAGGVRVASGSLEVSTLIAFLLYLFYVIEPISSLIMGANMLQEGLGAVDRLHGVQVLETEDDVDSAELNGAQAPDGDETTVSTTSVDAAPLAAQALVNDDRPATGNGARARPASITLRGVGFAYSDRSPALSGVTFDVPAGSCTALVGPSGSGKTTILALLQRFYDPQAGALLLDGQDISELRRADLRRRISYVEQDSPALSGTLAENLRYAAPNASGHDVAGVLRLTRLDELVARLPDGVDTLVGHRGTTLSGGERQRLAVARALLRRPDVLLLDEATSQLDARNEQALRDLVASVAGSCTVLLIAHRLSTVTAADQIVVLDAGRVRAAGRHEELLDGDDLYLDLATTQLIAPATDKTAR